MDFKQAFYDVLDKSTALALATAVDNTPNVRIVNFCYDSDKPGILYFASDRDNQKVTEIAKNKHIAFTSVPTDGSSVPHIRSNKAVCQKSELSITDVQALFIAKIPGYDETIAAIGNTLDVFEIHIGEVFVIVDYEHAGRVSF